MSRQKLTTPRGTLGFPCAIAYPDDHYADKNDPDDKGDFKARLLLDKGSPEQVALQEKLEAIFNEHLAEVCRTQNKTPKQLRIDPDHIPWFDATDREGNETGQVGYRFKMKARIKKKDGTTIDLRPKVFDSQGKLIKDVPNIGPGSEVKIGAEVKCYYTSKIGMGLRMNAVQLLKLVEGTGGSTADDFGFGEEDGYVEESDFERETATVGSEDADY